MVISHWSLVITVVVGNGNFHNLAADDWQDDKLVWLETIIRKEQATALWKEIVRNSQSKLFYL